MSQHFDIAVIGAGIVGCAMARHFTLAGAKVIIVEKAADVLDGASKGNSAILHTGFDAPCGSLEQKCIASGYKEYQKVAKELNLPILKSGAMVLAWNKEQASQLPDLIEKAHKNGVKDVAPLTKDEILKREPHLSKDVISGFEVPGESIIDPWTTAHAYLLQALANGAELRRDCEILSGDFQKELWTLKSNSKNIKTRFVINCAGLYGDIVDERLIGEKPFIISPRKGQFIVFDKAASQLVSSIILPVPTPTTKGIVMCRTIFGNLLVGPTAEEQKSRTDASTDRKTLLELQRRGIEMLPQLEGVEVTAAYAGIRPRSQFEDYQFTHNKKLNYVCVGGIRSTGLSSALGVAKHVAKSLGSKACSDKPIKKPILPKIDRLSEYHTRNWQEPDHGGIICHCEQVTRQEVEDVLDSPMPPSSLQGLKRRTRVCMGRCQGFYCLADVASMTKGRLKHPISESHDGK